MWTEIARDALVTSRTLRKGRFKIITGKFILNALQEDGFFLNLLPRSFRGR
jgi:hypothetical protein